MMPHATCFLIAYSIVFCLELGRFLGRIPWQQVWLVRAIVAMTAIGFVTHSLYLFERMLVAALNSSSWRLLSSWHDWGMLAAWGLAIAYIVLLIRRSETRVGLFVLPLLITFIAVAISITGPKRVFDPTATATVWRLFHGVAMTLGTMFVALGFAMAVMYFVQSWRLKAKLQGQGSFRLPSLEYLHSFGRLCLLWSTAIFGFGFVSGVVMNLTQDGRIEWNDKGILFSLGLFVWLVIAAAVEWQSSKRGRGEITAIINTLSFAIVIGVLAFVVSTPHGSIYESNKNELPPNDSPNSTVGRGV